MMPVFAGTSPALLSRQGVPQTHRRRETGRFGGHRQARSSARSRRRSGVRVCLWSERQRDPVPRRGGGGGGDTFNHARIAKRPHVPGHAAPTHGNGVRSASQRALQISIHKRRMRSLSANTAGATEAFLQTFPSLPFAHWSAATNSDFSLSAQGTAGRVPEALGSAGGRADLS